LNRPYAFFFISWSNKIRVRLTDIISSLSPLRCHLSSGRHRHATAPCHASFPWRQNKLAVSASSSGNALSRRLFSQAKTEALNPHHHCRPITSDRPTHTLHCYKNVILTLTTLSTTEPRLYFASFLRKVLSPDGWGSRVAPRGLEFDPLVGRISGLVKKIPSLCLVRSWVLSLVHHPPAWAVPEWAVVADPLVMGDQGSGVFLTGTCWFRDFLAISGLCAPWVSAPGDVSEGDFPLPGRFFFILPPF
jgi:hypothetical protein